ncbi:TonB-dependent receptor [Roseateles koreensis]|uniref:TonB-dependent receptor n=1 Tax=Roseateles koreensis TaxID=2987526 RepID=A0ABT5KQN6_9BURK|nr:TonB-dependent receptor [Roseateles koreensis]MDC8784688.1 TonB-dependent receptor [Roseateles koreensis]
MSSHASGFRKFLGSPVQLAVVTLLAGASSVYAQSQAPEAAAKAADSKELPTVIVTATKSATSLQRTPVAVTAINATSLEDNRVNSLLDVFNLVPSLQGTGQGDHGIVSVTLRGIGNDSAKTEYADPEVSLFVDGVFSPRPEGASTLMFDLDGVEVMRGPQGTLWGRNSTVGTINLKTAKPKLNDQSGYVEAGIGTYSRMGMRGALNMPVSDTLAFRVAFVHEQHDGYVDFQKGPNLSVASQQAAYIANGGTLATFKPMNTNLFVQDGPKYNAQDQSAVRVSMLWKPTAAFSWDLSVEQFRDRGTPSMNLMQTPRAGESQWSALIEVAPTLVRDSTNVRSHMEYDLGDMILAYTAGMGRFKGSSTFDAQGGMVVPTYFDDPNARYQNNNTVWSKYNSQSHEVTLASSGRKTLDWILGAYYAAEDNGIRFDIPIMNGTQEGSVAWQGSFIQPKETVETKAVFGQATFNVSDALHLTGGVRFTTDRRENVGGGSWTWQYDATVPQTPLNANFDPKTQPGYAQGDHNSAVYTNDKTTYLARVGYDLSKDAMVYGSVSTGYKSGGTGDGGHPYGPETLTNYEAGLKTKLMGGRMTFNTSVYYMDFKDFQFSSAITNPDGTRGFAYDNAEGAKVSGAEVEVATLVGNNGRLQLAASFTKTKLGHLVGKTNDYILPVCFSDKTTNCMDVTGHELPHAPKFALQLQYEHNFDLESGATLTPRASAHYQTDTWLSVFNLGDGDKQKAYATLDLGLRYAAKKNWYVDGFVRNVTDQLIKTSAGSGGQNRTVDTAIWTAQYQAPRTVQVNAGYSF